MLSERERVFMEYWEANKEKERKTFRQLLIGIPVGLLFAVPVLVALFSGRFWYKRAEAEANSETSPVVIIVAILLIAGFVAIFYKKHQWDMKEQRYRELLYKKEMEKNNINNIGAAK